MQAQIFGFLEEYAVVLGALAAITAIILFVAWLVEKFSKRTVADQNKQLDQDKEELRLALVRAEVRLDHIEHERFIDRAAELYDAAEFDKVEELATRFIERQQEAIGKAAEYLTEQNILDSETGGEAAIAEAKRYAAIGRAMMPASKRLSELGDLAKRRADDIERGDPIEALNMEGMTYVELYELSLALFSCGKYVLAEVAARRSVPLSLLRTGEQSADYAAALNQHAMCLQGLGYFTDAGALLNKALEIDRATIGTGHPNYAIRLSNLAGVVQAQGRLPEAETLYREALEIDRATIGTGHPDHATHLSNLAVVVRAQGRFPEAETLFNKALEIDRATIGTGHPAYATRLNNLAAVVEVQGRFPEAETLFNKALEIARATIGTGHPDYASHLNNLASVVQARGRFPEAETLFREALEIDRATIGTGHPDYATHLNNFAGVYRHRAVSPKPRRCIRRR